MKTEFYLILLCMMRENQATEEQVGKQVTSLLNQSGISVVGLAHGIEMSVNHIRTIKSGKASISSKTASKIARFFEIEIGVLFSEKMFKLKKWDSIPSLCKFYEENKNNSQFFLNRKGENSVAHFIKVILIPTDYFLILREVNEIQDFIKKQYKKEFSSKELSRQLNRLANAGILIKKDKTGNRSIFLYGKIVKL